jgi:ubiquinone/menaquinone biosynthesis C-methylase UbiE
MTGHPVFAALYDRMNGAAEREIFAPLRARLLADLPGVVLDVGAGTGANLPHFRAATRVHAVEPDPAMRTRLTAKLDQAAVPVDVTAAPAETLPFADAAVDAVVFTLVLCSVADQAKTLAEARRVLKPGGRLAVLEHVRNTGSHARWQRLATPLCIWLAGGCHPNRDTPTAIEQAGFTFEEREILDPLPKIVPTRPWLYATASVR